MHKILFLSIALILFSCNSETFVENNDPIIYTEDDVPALDEQLLGKYYSDAAYINFVEIIGDSINKENQILLNSNKTQQHFNDLLNIHKKSYLLGNSFFENFLRVDNFYKIIMYQMFAIVDSQKAWIQNILSGYNFTGVASIDSLISNYGLVINNPQKYNEDFMINIYTEAPYKPYNTFALSKKFMDTQEFNYFDPNGIGGDASSIDFKMENNLRTYTYRLGWGDCEVGCMSNHYWEIGIDDSNSVSLLREYGDTIPKN